MKLHPDTIVILQPKDTNNPYGKAEYEQVYRGECKCFLDKKSAFRTNKVMDNTFQVVIPNRNMPDIGEGYKVAVRYHTSPKDTGAFDLVGHVVDFSRYNRVCNLYFQIVKEEMIAADVPEEE